MPLQRPCHSGGKLCRRQKPRRHNRNSKGPVRRRRMGRRDLGRRPGWRHMLCKVLVRNGGIEASPGRCSDRSWDRVEQGAFLVRSGGRPFRPGRGATSSQGRSPDHSWGRGPALVGTRCRILDSGSKKSIPLPGGRLTCALTCGLLTRKSAHRQDRRQHGPARRHHRPGTGAQKACHNQDIFGH